MKEIGRTKTGNRLIEMTENEFSLFERLARAAEGKTIDELICRGFDGDLPDFAGVFGAIEAFTLAQFHVNEIINLANEFNRVINSQ